MISIVIVNWNTRELLRDCLHSIIQFAPQEPIEIIVVDNASTDHSAEMVSENFPTAILIPNEKNVGYARGNNIGISKSTGDLILTLNPDTRFFDDSLERAARQIRQDPKVGVLGIKLLNSDGTAQKSVRGFPTPGNIFFEIFGLGAFLKNSKSVGLYRQTGFDYSRTQLADQPMGTFLLFKKELLDKIGPFDEQFPIFFNEVDLLHRAKRAGFNTLYFAEASIYHLGGASTRQVRKSMIWESHRSLIRYLKKWHLTRANAVLMFPLFGLIWLGALVRARGVYAGFRT